MRATPSLAYQHGSEVATGVIPDEYRATLRWTVESAPAPAPSEGDGELAAAACVLALGCNTPQGTW